MAKRKGSRRWLGWMAIAFLGFALLAYCSPQNFDHQNANIAFALSLLLASLFGLLWFLLQSSIAIAIRALGLLVPIAGLFLFLKMYEFRGFSGELVPQFRIRNPSQKSMGMEKMAASESETLPSSTENEGLSTKLPFFHQFLGNERTGVVSDIQLAEDWDKRPPRMLWKRSIGRGWSGFAVQNGLAITLEEYEGRDCIVAFGWDDGSLKWRTPLERSHYDPRDGGGPSATPTIDGDRFYVQSSTGIIGCGELQSGKLIWKVDLLEMAGITQAEAEIAIPWGRSGSPLIYDDLVIVPFGNATGRSPSNLVALDRLTGDERWRGSEAQISYASPSIMSIRGIEQIVIVNESTVTGHDPKTGVALWSHDWPGSSNGGATVSQAVSIDPSRVFLSKGYGGGAEMLDFSNSTPTSWMVKTKWKNAQLLKTKFTSSIYRDGYLYGLSDGIIECVEAEDGKRMWKDARNGRLGHGQMLLVGNHLVICSEDGRIVMGSASPLAFQKIGDIPVLSGITWNTLAIAGNLCWLRNGEEAACMELPVQNDQPPK